MRIEEVIGLNMARLREQAGLTQEQLGTALGPYLGKPWTRQAVSAAEKGRRSFMAAELVALALALGTSIQFLMLPVHPNWMAELLPGDAEVTTAKYDQAISGQAYDGTVSPEALHRAQSALTVTLKDMLDLHTDFLRHFDHQSVFLDTAAAALGIRDVAPSKQSQATEEAAE